MGFWDFMTGATPGGVAGEVAQKTIGGIFEGVKGIIDEFHMSPEDKAKLQLALLNQQVQATQQILNDVQNARQMQIQTRSIWPGLLSAIIVCGFFGGSIYVLVNGMPKDLDDLGKQIINMNSVALISGLSAVIGYWLGSSASSQEKNQLLYNSIPNKKD